MRELSAQRLRRRREPQVGIAPLIDMVFILLIFFLATTSFARETGVTVNKPAAVTAEALQKQSILVAITSKGTIHINQRQVDPAGLRTVLRRTLRRRARSSVVIIADRSASAGRIVEVIDACKLAGAEKVSLASIRKR